MYSVYYAIIQRACPMLVPPPPPAKLCESSFIGVAVGALPGAVLDAASRAHAHEDHAVIIASEYEMFQGHFYVLCETVWLLLLRGKY